MQQQRDLLEKHTEKLEVQTKKSKRKRGAQKSHKGHQQQMLEPTKVKKIIPEGCDCGRLVIDPDSIKSFYTHQHIELPEIKVPGE